MDANTSTHATYIRSSNVSSMDCMGYSLGVETVSCSSASVREKKGDLKVITILKVKAKDQTDNPVGHLAS
ncbi:hypothetical protein GX50_01939 [[Emmonsia] crescens]|uniref:Uncharacterized protein n=1 Tax=[Emmonsia] crescens TaxID=73230 RepID=A0A2B7ZPX8_9EURO|nr:hypothetical protein GX50_01939 [Emmonsia crescens]